MQPHRLRVTGNAISGYLFSPGVPWRVLALSLCLILKLSHPACAQEEKIRSDYYSNHAPRRPGDGTLGTFGNTPVNLFTGLPQVSIPLMELRGRMISLPVSLQYDASGIRTDELSGMAGLKWTLSAGGYVVREVNGLPDEDHENGFLKHSRESDYFRTGEPTSWSVWCERDLRDTAPDDYHVVINGRTIRFSISKNGVALPMPRQDVAIRVSFSSQSSPEQRISGFEVVLEDGSRYSFGGAAAIADRKVETLLLYASLSDRVFSECGELPDTDPRYVANGHSYDCGASYSLRYDANPEHQVRTMTYNYKWYLTAITLPGGESMRFDYSRAGAVVYATRPSMVRIWPVSTFVEKLTRSTRTCAGTRIGKLCLGSWIVTSYNYYNHPALVKYGLTNPGTDPPAGGGVLYHDPFAIPPNGGAANFYHTLITEGHLQLRQITSATGNRVVLATMPADDLPGSSRYESIALYNTNGRLVRSLRFRYSTITGVRGGEQMWMGEAFLFHHLPALKSDKQVYYAPDLLAYGEDEIANANLRRFVFEGLKEYNYRRVFLAAIDDDTQRDLPRRTYAFTYLNPDKLRRRTSPHHSLAGLTTTNPAVATHQFAPGRYASYSWGGQHNSAEPSAGILAEIRYPTSAVTRFTYQAVAGEAKLVRVEDLEDGDVLLSKEFRYAFKSHALPVVRSYQEFKVSGSEEWIKYAVVSSSPQNDSYATIQGTSCRTIVFNGSADDNEGFEIYRYSDSADPDYADEVTAIRSYPEETNTDGSSLRNIFPFPRNTEREYLRGLLLSRQVYRKGTSPDRPTHPVVEETYDYQVNPGGFVPDYVMGFKGGSFVYTTLRRTSAWYGYQANPVHRNRYGWYKLISDWVVLKEKTVSRCDDEDPEKCIAVVTNYEYDPEHLQRVGESMYVAQQPGHRLITRIRNATDPDYHFDRTECDRSLEQCHAVCLYSSDPACKTTCMAQYEACLSADGSADFQGIRALVETHQNDVPVEIQQWLEQGDRRKLVSARVFVYRRTGAAGAPALREVWECHDGLAEESYTESRIGPEGEFIKDSCLRLVHAYNDFDPRTLDLLRQTGSDGIVTEYKWDEKSGYVGEAVRNPGPGEHREFFSVTPLVGTESMTDPNGRVTYFRYDSWGRLSHVLDHDQNFRRRLRYHYKGESPGTLNAGFTASGARIAGTEYTFQTSAEHRDYGDVVCEWTFGDGVVREGTATTVSHVYRSPGTYVVMLKKSHPEYGSVTSSLAIRVYDALTATACVDGPYLFDVPPATISPQPGNCTRLPMDVNNTLIRANVSGGCPGYRYEWQELTGGAWVRLASTGSATAAPDGFTGRLPGKYTVRCVVTDGCGNVVVTPPVSLSII